MATDYGYWLQSMRAALENMSSREFQEASWFGGGIYVSSPTEVLNQVFDDNHFDQFVTDANIGLSEDCRIAAHDLKKTVDEFVASTPEGLDKDLDPYATFVDLTWQLIRGKASIVLGKLPSTTAT